MVNIKLKSSDGVVFEVDVVIAKCFGLINNILDCVGISEDDEEAVSLPCVNSAILKKVINIQSSYITLLTLY